jgi:alkanesulfonate monooxygenase SsuD/methylene tetrahydromethanopterin reductase-like flavin-dependent oxidoreductase (luciferase family)
MVQKIRFGVVTLPNVEWPTLVERWKHLEELGFDSIWTIDHFVNPYAITQPWFDGWTLLAALATQTKRARIGVLVSSATFRNPSLLAKQALTLDHISQGRLELGIGAGGHKTDYSMTGIPFISDTSKRLQGFLEVIERITSIPCSSIMSKFMNKFLTSKRVQRFREVVEIVDKLLDKKHILDSKNGQGTTYKGTYIKIENAINTQEPYQKPIPITLAAHIEPSLKLAARYANTWISYGGRDLSPKQTYEITRERIEKLQDYCKDYKRDPEQIRKAFLVGFTKDEPFASEETFRKFVGDYSELGITDFIFYDPANEFYHSPKQDKKELFEHIARNVFPEFQQKDQSKTPVPTLIQETTSTPVLEPVS